ncbi:molybdenum cofactor biosysynthesis protein [Streptomyces sp. AM8-1-1]|uniref:molybdenum cofactor biosysynthesis protein n=1 Tax=Streptomyces sp. AM8-1-1 TaxID=3075825 RepID=UPI0028C3FE41|nr:molybdenum cofactor biosysynthesis protein [Streptomyces sp. AM8-1-1]WNO76689.1 molybdenum cofactor biosysynthesis protein [Streptomyces sp. AM8-1-1]
MTMVEVVQLLLSPTHRYMGRPADGPAAAHEDELVEAVTVRRNLGIVGDRYFGHPAHRRAAITLMAEENLPTDINATVDLRQTRRNVLLRGVDIDAYVGSTVSLDSGSGPVLLAVNSAARPCAWMNTTIGDGAQRALRGKGGVRCTPLSDGVLTLGAAAFTTDAMDSQGTPG